MASPRTQADGGVGHDTGATAQPPVPLEPSCTVAPGTHLESWRLTGERALFASKDLTLTSCTFADGESPLKGSRGVTATDCVFEWKYPLWYCTDVTVTGGALLETARSGIWYTHDLTMRDTLLAAPKTFRRASHLTLERVSMPHASETLWTCQDVALTDVTATGDYLAKDSQRVTATRLNLTGNYAFDGCRDVTVTDSVIISKDAFWNCEHVRIERSTIIGEYLAWNTKDLTLVDCTIISEQGLSYVDGLTMRGCRTQDTDRALEYSTGLDVEVRGTIDSVLNPTSGTIRASHIGTLVRDPRYTDPAATTILTDDAAASPTARA